MTRKNIQISFKQELFPVLLIILIVLLYFLPLFFGNIIYAGDPPSISDATEVNLALKFILFKDMRQSALPLWEDSISSGYPLLAESQIGFFYPFHLIFKWLPFLTAFNLQFFIHWILGAIFFYFYCRLIRLSRPASLLAAFSFIFSGYFVGHSKHLNLVEASIWLPLFLLLIELFWRSRKRIFLLLLAPILTLQFLAGHAQIVYYSIAFIILYFLGRLFYITQQQSSISFKERLSIATVFASSLFLGLGMSTMVILPTYELTNFSWRVGGLSHQAYLSVSYHLKNLIYWFFPFFYGNVAKGTYTLNAKQAGLPWETMSYIGLLPFLLALSAIHKIIIHKKFRSMAFFWLLIFFSSLLFILSLNSQLGYIFWYLVPGLSFFRAHARLILISIMAAAVLSAFGFDYLLGRIKKRVYISKIIIISIIGLSLVNLFYFNYNFNSFFNGHHWLEQPSSVRFLKQDKSYFRILSFGLDYTYNAFYQQSGQGWLANHYLFFNNREQLQPNTNAIFSIDNVENTLGLSFIRHAILISLANKYGIKTNLSNLDYPKENQVVLKDNYLKVFGMQNVKYLLTFYKLKNKNLTLVHQVKFKELQMPLNIYLNKYWLPRAYLVYNIINVPPPVGIRAADTKIQLAARMLADKINFSDTAIVEGFVQLKDTVKAGGAEQRVKILKWKNGVILLKTTSPQESFLVINNSYYPGWHAYLDNQEVYIYRTNYLYQGVKIPPGEHQVKLYFNPRSFNIGKQITFIFTALFIIIFMHYGFYALKQKQN